MNFTHAARWHGGGGPCRGRGRLAPVNHRKLPADTRCANAKDDDSRWLPRSALTIWAKTRSRISKTDELFPHNGHNRMTDSIR